MKETSREITSTCSSEHKRKSKLNKRQRQLIRKRLIQLICFELILFSLFVIFMYDCREMTENNTVTIVGKPENVRYHNNPNRADDITMQINGIACVLSLRQPIAFSGDRKQIVKALMKEEQVSVTVGESRNILNLNPAKGIVDIRSDSTIYYDVLDYNANQFQNRCLAGIACLIVFLVGTAFFVFLIKIKL